MKDCNTYSNLAHKDVESERDAETSVEDCFRRTSCSFQPFQVDMAHRRGELLPAAKAYSICNV